MTSFETLIRFERPTVAEAIIIFLAVILPIVGYMIRRLRERTYPFKFHVDGRRVEHGQTKRIPVRLQSRTPMTLERLNVRFIEKAWLGFSNTDAPKTDVEIVDVSNISWRVPSSASHTCSDGAGGYDIIFDPRKNWVAGDFLYLDIEVAAHKKWSGHLSFEAVTTKYRLRARQFFEIT